MPFVNMPVDNFSEKHVQHYQKIHAVFFIRNSSFWTLVSILLHIRNAWPVLPELENSADTILSSKRHFADITLICKFYLGYGVKRPFLLPNFYQISWSFCKFGCNLLPLYLFRISFHTFKWVCLYLEQLLVLLKENLKQKGCRRQNFLRFFSFFKQNFAISSTKP